MPPSNNYTLEKKPSKFKKLINFIKPGSFKKNLVLFAAAFAIVGGAYLGYRSFAGIGPLGSSGEFTALTPARILDTRNGTGGYNQPLGSGQTYDVQVTGQGNVPASDVKAVVMNVTVTGGTASSFLTVFPTGQPNPGTSNLNFGANQTIANQVTVKVGANGKVSIYNPNGNVHVIFDVAGYYSDVNGNAGSRFVPVNPARILDTRNGTGGYNQPLGPGQTDAVQVSGQGGLPATGVRAVVMNVTVTGGTANSFLTVWPSDVGMPSTSSINFGANQTLPNQVTVKVGSDGKVKVYNPNGNVHVIFDVAGYYTDPSDPASMAGRFIPLDNPTRILDTRNLATGQVGQWGYPVDADGQQGWPKLSNVQGVVMNATVTGGTANSFLTVWPDGNWRPNTSNLNFSVGQTIANQVTVGVGKDGKISLFNAGGGVQVILDLAGYFAGDNTTTARLDMLPQNLGTHNFNGPQPSIVSDTFNGSTFSVMNLPPATTTIWPGVSGGSVIPTQEQSFVNTYSNSPIRVCATVRALSGTGNIEIRNDSYSPVVFASDARVDVQVPSTSYGEVCTYWTWGSYNGFDTPVFNTGNVPILVKQVSWLADNNATPVIYRQLPYYEGQDSSSANGEVSIENGAVSYFGTNLGYTNSTSYVGLQPNSQYGIGFATNYSSTYFGLTPPFASRQKIFCAYLKSPDGISGALMLASGSKGTDQILIGQSNEYTKVCDPTPMDGTVLPSIGSNKAGHQIDVQSIQVEIR